MPAGVRYDNYEALRAKPNPAIRRQGLPVLGGLPAFRFRRAAVFSMVWRAAKLRGANPASSPDPRGNETGFQPSWILGMLAWGVAPGCYEVAPLALIRRVTGGAKNAVPEGHRPAAIPAQANGLGSEHFMRARAIGPIHHGTPSPVIHKFRIIESAGISWLVPQWLIV
jgi:hypothetical protein